jgi:hypothetical protein
MRGSTVQTLLMHWKQAECALRCTQMLYDFVEGVTMQSGPASVYLLFLYLVKCVFVCVVYPLNIEGLLSLHLGGKCNYS